MGEGNWGTKVDGQLQTSSQGRILGSESGSTAERKQGSKGPGRAEVRSACSVGAIWLWRHWAGEKAGPENKGSKNQTSEENGEELGGGVVRREDRREREKLLEENFKIATSLWGTNVSTRQAWEWWASLGGGCNGYEEHDFVGVTQFIFQCEGFQWCRESIQCRESPQLSKNSPPKLHIKLVEFWA